MALTNRICAFATCLTLAWTHIACAYQQETHRKITEASANNSILAATTGNVLADFGLKPEIAQTSTQKFPNSNGELKAIIWLIQDGADFEDNGIRSVQHFYDPINDRSLQHPLLTLAGGTNKSPDWAIEDVGAITAQEYSYADAVEAFYQALTLPTKAERDAKWGKLFETLGHVIHHVQDMAQPEHVRNDLHCGEVVPCGIPGAVLGLYDQSLFESRSLEVFKDGIPGTLVNYPPVTFPTAHEFWTTRDTDSSVAARRGLADFTNRNFVSKDTNFELISGALSPSRKYDLPAPIVDPTNRYSLAQLMPGEGDGICQALNNSGPIDLPPNAPCEIEFIKTNVTDSYAPAQSGINPKAASLSLFDQYLIKYNVSSVHVGDGDAVHMVDVDRLVTINRFNIDEAHKFLIPRAVAYGAGLINHFFKIRLSLSKAADTGDWEISNDSDVELEGKFELYTETVVSGVVEKMADISNVGQPLAANDSLTIHTDSLPRDIVYAVFYGRAGDEGSSNIADGELHVVGNSSLAEPPKVNITVNDTGTFNLDQRCVPGGGNIGTMTGSYQVSIVLDWGNQSYAFQTELDGGQAVHDNVTNGVPYYDCGYYSGQTQFPYPGETSTTTYTNFLVGYPGYFSSGDIEWTYGQPSPFYGCIFNGQTVTTSSGLTDSTTCTSIDQVISFKDIISNLFIQAGINLQVDYLISSRNNVMPPDGYHWPIVWVQ